MVEIKKINWISKESLEAEIYVTDGINEILCFSQPFVYTSHEKVNFPLNTLNANNIIKSENKIFSIERINSTYEYFLQGKLINLEKKLVQVGGFFIELDSDLPGGIFKEDYVCFSCDRIDIYQSS